MKVLFALIISIALISCASTRRLSLIDEAEIAKLTLDYAISTWKGCFGCNIKYLFLGVERKTLDRDFLEHFKYPGLVIASQEETETDCENGIISKETGGRGYAFSVFEVTEMKKDRVEVKWGHWYSCKSYSYKYSTLVKISGKWSIVPTSSSS